MQRNLMTCTEKEVLLLLGSEEEFKPAFEIWQQPGK
jgi:hypothetical protein